MVESKRVLGFITIVEVKVVDRKTRVFNILSNSKGYFLGSIHWYGAWRQYAFTPEQESIFSAGCLRDITNFIDDLNRDHRSKRRTKTDGQVHEVQGTAG